MRLPAVAVAQHDRPLRHWPVRSAQLDRLLDPGCATAGKPAARQTIARRPIRIGTQKFELGIVWRQDKPCTCKSCQITGKFTEREERQPSGSEIDPMAGAEPGPDDIDHTIGSAVGNDPHCGPAIQGSSVSIHVLPKPPLTRVAMVNRRDATEPKRKGITKKG